SVYDDSYEGSSTDLTDPSSVAFTFTKADEVRIVGALALSTSILRTQINLGLAGGWIHTHYASDPPGWIAVQVPAYSIHINDLANGEYEVRSPGIGRMQTLEFTLQPTSPDPTSPTDTTW